MVSLPAGLSGLVQKAQSALPTSVKSIIPGAGTPITAAGAATSGQSKIKQIMLEGTVVSGFIQKIVLFILAGGIAIKPFNYWGFGGMNLMAAGKTMWAGAKAATAAVCSILSKYMDVYYPSLWPMKILIEVNPWYIFDLIQLFSPMFATEGFKVPFVTGPAGSLQPKDGAYRINGIMIGAAIALLSMGGYSLLQNMPSQIVGASKPALDLLFKVVGGASVVGGGGLTAYALLPQLLSSAKGNLTEIQAAVATPAPAPASAPAPAAAPAPATQIPGAPPAPPPILPSIPQSGGGGTGGSIPSLREIANGMLGADPRGFGAPYHSGILSGGGSAQGPDIGSALFLGTLAIACLGGISLALIRSKTASQ